MSDHPRYMSVSNIHLARELGVSPEDNPKYRHGLKAIVGSVMFGAVDVVAIAYDSLDGQLTNLPLFTGVAALTPGLGRAGIKMIDGPLSTAYDAIDKHRQQR